MSEQNTADLQALVGELTKRLEALEGEVATLKASQAIPEDVMVAISAAVAAFLGHDAKVRAVHMRGGRNFAVESRGTVHNRRVH